MASAVKVGTLCAVILGVYLQTAQGRLRRCYICRSRGELGDCKDPFEYNATSVEDIRGVEAVPCASGWCAKITEGETDDFDIATERMCVQRPPADGEERCSDTIIDRKHVYMCFCQGDLCNGAKSQQLMSNEFLMPFILAIFAYYINKWRHSDEDSMAMIPVGVFCKSLMFR
ncbi:uncharacterized protein TNCT_241241 [Trichonephila clavata]|uniref:Protein sleepless n=1 Tax=Trichonephila clavata TaxID=2740835 RepID=A0A8X6G371_TRICU|nr:uncharacterized protein TNCT_241241 [Trichonephila clavata]